MSQLSWATAEFLRTNGFKVAKRPYGRYEQPVKKVFSMLFDTEPDARQLLYASRHAKFPNGVSKISFYGVDINGEMFYIVRAMRQIEPGKKKYEFYYFAVRNGLLDLFSKEDVKKLPVESICAVSVENLKAHLAIINEFFTRKW